MARRAASGDMCIPIHLDPKTPSPRATHRIGSVYRMPALGFAGPLPGLTEDINRSGVGSLGVHGFRISAFGVCFVDFRAVGSWGLGLRF